MESIRTRAVAKHATTDTKQCLQREWRRWADQAARASTIKRLASKYTSGVVYRIRHRILFDTPIAVRVRRRNYGDGWVKAEDIELRSAIELPGWTRVPPHVRAALARERPH